MAKLRVNWAPQRLLAFEEVVRKPGYYFNTVSGDLYRHEEASEATLRDVPLIERAERLGLQPQAVASRIWLAITDDLDLTESEVRALLRDGFHVRMVDQGRLIGHGRT